MRRIILGVLLSVASALAAAQGPKPLELAADAPDRHIVKRGDTLWGISGRFLKDPWRWPEIWRLNRDQIRNPHRIYPGQVVVLDHSTPGQPRLTLAEPVGKLEPKVYEEASVQPISSIPQKDIEPFLAEPRVVEAAGMAQVAKIIATHEDRVFVGRGDRIYATAIAPGVYDWHVFRPARAIKDPETGEVLGFEAFFLGNARVTREGEPATLEVVSAKQEMGRGDFLLPASRPEIVAYAPRAPENDVQGRVVGLYGGIDSTGETGRNYIVTLNRGKREGMEVGHVLALYRAGRDVTYREEERKEFYTLPDERIGLVFVFRVYERMAYALVMDASRPVKANDIVRKP